MDYVGNLLKAVRELDEAWDDWDGYAGTDKEKEFAQRKRIAAAVGSVKGLAFIVEQERNDKGFSDFQHREHLYGTENSHG